MVTTYLPSPNASFIEVIFANDYILHGFDSAAQMYSVFFLEKAN